MAFDPSDFSLVFTRVLGEVIVHIHGPLDANSADELQHGLVDMIDGQGNRQLVLDLRKTTRIDAAGFSVLVDALRRQQKRGGDLVLNAPTSEVAEALAAAGLDKVFVITPEWRHPAHGHAGTNVHWLRRSG